MAKDENGLNLALEADSAETDDDVIDLLEVVKPGKSVSKVSGEDEDFSADLESMLETLSKAEQAKAGEEGAQFFPDPTPVDHEVDPDESLDMPGMGDLDDILNALGAPARELSSEREDPSDAPVPDAADMPDLDAVPAAQGRNGPAPPPSPEEDLLAGSGLDASSSSPEEDLLAEFGLDASSSSPEEDLLAESGLDASSLSPKPAVSGAPQKTPVDLEGLPLDIGDDAHTPPLAGDASLAAQTGDMTPDGDLFAGARPEAAFAQVPEESGEIDDLDAMLAVAPASDAPSEEAGEPFAASPEKKPEAIEFDAAFEAAGTLGEDVLASLPDPDPAVPQDAAPVPEPDEDGAGEQPAAALDSGVSVFAQSGIETPEPEAVAENTLAETGMEEAESDAPLPLSAQTAPEITEEDIMPVAVDTALNSISSARFDEVDLNELDALLDDMLASAPVSGPSPADTSASGDSDQEGHAEPAPQLKAPEETAPAADSDAADSPLSAELALLRIDMESLRRELAAARPSPQEAVPAASGIDAKIEDMELTLQNLDSRIQSVEAQLNALQMNIDKFAAEAAAKIIREELAALLEAGI